MQGIKRLKEAVQKHRENKDINIRYKTPLTSKCHSICQVVIQQSIAYRMLTTPVRNIANHCDSQAIDDACNPLRSNRSVLISNWLRSVQGVSQIPQPDKSLR